MKRVVVCLAMAFVALAVQAQKSDSVEKAVAGLEQQWTSAAKMSDAKAVAPLLADGFINMDSDGTMHNKAESLARLKDQKWELNEISDVKVTVHGNTAIATGEWRGKGTDANGKAVDAHERWVDTWMKMANGKWQCVASASAPSKM